MPAHTYTQRELTHLESSKLLSSRPDSYQEWDELTNPAQTPYEESNTSDTDGQ